jgi:hypothetical protein
VLRAGDTKATLYGYLPQASKAPGAFTGTQLSASSVYPSAGAPTTVSTTLPVYTGTSNDSTIADLVATLPNTDDTDDGYAGLYELRLKTGANGLAPTAKYDAVDIAVTGTSWQVVYPVSTGGTTTALTAAGTSGPVGTATTLTATVSPSTAAGSVQFADGSTNLGSPVLVSSGVATTSWTPSTVGAHTLTATFTPSDSSSPSVGTLVYDVNKAQASLTGTWSTTTPTYGRTYTVAAKVTVHGVSPTGTVTLFNGTSNIGSATLSSGSATITVGATKLAPGSHTETLSYAGSSTISGTATTQKITEGQASSTTKISLSPTSVTTTKSTKVTITVTATGVTPTGAIDLYDAATGSHVSAVTLTAADKGKVVATLPVITKAGSYEIHAKYLGSTDVKASTSASSKLTVSLTSSATKISLSATSVTTAKQIKVTITVTASGTTPTGTIDLYQSASGARVAAVTLSAKDKGKVTVTFPLIKKTGSYEIHAKYLGSTQVKTSTSASAKLTVKKA